MINFAEIIAHELRKRGLDVSWNDREQFRIIWPDGHMTFTIINSIIYCWHGEYSLYENRSIDGFVEAAAGCWERRSCVRNGCPLFKE